MRTRLPIKFIDSRPKNDPYVSRYRFKIGSKNAILCWNTDQFYYYYNKEKEGWIEPVKQRISTVAKAIPDQVFYEDCLQGHETAIQLRLQGLRK